MKLKQLPSGKWKADYYLGSRRCRPEGWNKKQLEQAANKAQYEYIQKGITPEAYKSVITFEEACDKYMRLYAIPNGQVQDRYHMPLFQKYLGASTKLSQIGVEELQEMKADLLRRWAPSTLNRRWTLLTGVFREAIKNGYISTNPCKLVPKQKGADVGRTRYLTSEEIYTLLASLPTEYRLFAEVAINTGFRLGNLVRLEWADIDFRQGTITAVKTKNYKAYAVPIVSKLWPTLKELKELGSNPRVFRPHNWGHRLRPRFDALGWKDVSIHTFRHTFASHLAMQGMTAKMIKEYTGHKTITMVDRYMHLSPDFKQAMVASFGFHWAPPGDRLLDEAKGMDRALNSQLKNPPSENS